MPIWVIKQDRMSEFANVIFFFTNPGPTLWHQVDIRWCLMQILVTLYTNRVDWIFFFWSHSSFLCIYNIISTDKVRNHTCPFKNKKGSNASTSSSVLRSILRLVFLFVPSSLHRAWRAKRGNNSGKATLKWATPFRVSRLRLSAVSIFMGGSFPY